MPPLSVPLAAIRQPAFLYAAGGRIAEANDRAEALAGRPLAGLTAADVAAILHARAPDGAPIDPAGLPAARALAGEEVVDLPVVVTAADGRTVEVLATASPVHDGVAVAGALVLWQDVTERKRTEEAEARLRALMDHNPSLVFLKDEDGRYVYLNETYERRFVHAKDWCGKTDFDFWPAESAELFRAKDREVLASGRTHQFLEDSTDLDGTRYAWLTSKFPFTDTRGERYVGGIGIDATAFVRAEEALRESEEKYRTLFTTMAQGFCIIERVQTAADQPFDFRYITANQAFERHTGMHDVIGKTIRELVPDCEESVMDLYDDVVRTGQPRKVEAFITALDFWMEAEVMPAEKPGQIAILFSNVTERKRAEEVLRKSEARQALLAGVAERLLRTDEPQAVVDELCWQALSVLDCDVFFNYLADAASGRLLLNAYGGIPADEAQQIRHLDDGADVSGCVARDGCRVVAEAIRDHPDTRTDPVAGYGVRAYACHPLVVAGRTIGTLSFGTKSRDTLTVDDLATMMAVADLIAVAMQRIADRDALRAGEERLRLAQESASVGIYDRDAATDRVTISPLFLARYGVAAGAFAYYRDWVGFIHPDDRDRVEAERRSASDADRPLDLEFRVLVPSGRTAWLQFRGRGIRDGGGAVVRVLGVLTDMTERKLAEQALRESEEQFRRAIEDAPIPIILHAEDGQVLQLNRTWTELTGYGPEDVPTFDAWLTRAYGEGADEVRDHTQSLFRGDRRTIGIEFPVRTRDGDQRYWSFSASSPGALADGRRYVIGMAVDITERKQAEEALAADLDALTQMHALSGRLVESGGLQSLLQEIMDTALTIMGAEKGTLRLVEGGSLRFVASRGHDTRFLAFFTSADARASACGLAMAQVDRVVVPDVEESPLFIGTDSLAVLRAAGVRAVQSTPLLSREGEPLGVLTTQWPRPYEPDEHALWRLDLLARQAADLIERARAVEALRAHAESLRRSNEDLERFAYVASHDLQEPLRSIVSFSQLLERRYKGKLGEDADEYIEFIVEGGTRMQGLILDLLTFSRVNTTRQQIARTDAEDVLAEAVRALDGSLREAGATLTHDPLPVVMADPVQLLQVFSNLVSNAVKFRRPDEPLRVHVGVRRAGGVWEFSVKDNGIGIEPEYYDKIFVIFQRLHTKETYPGTGIGLAIVKRIVDRHGGTVRVESTPGEGSTFSFTLPVA